MGTITFEKNAYQVDAHGYLDPPDQWDRDFAIGMARHLGMDEPMSPLQWGVIDFIRNYVRDNDDIPFLHQTCREFELSLDGMRELFPPGYHRGAFRIAGLSFLFMVNTNIWFTYETTALKRDRTPTCTLGFLNDPSDWTREYAERVAADHEIEGGLTGAHWRVVRSIRARFEKTGVIPLVCEVCERNDLSLGELMELFPRGYHKGACKIAGLNPRS